MPNMNDDSTMVARAIFDNEDFQRRIAQTQASLKEFEAKIKDTKGFQAFEKLGAGIKKITFDPVKKEASGFFDSLGKSINNLKRQLDGVKNEIEIGFLRDLGGKISNKIVELTKQFTGITGIQQGWGQYESTITNTKAIMNATGMRQDEVSKYLERLVFFSDETSYDYAEMLDNTKKLLSIGLSSDEALKTVEGMATWAAKSGASKTEFSIAMNNMVQAMSSGSLKMIDWKSIMRSSVSMATPEFKQTVMKVLKEMGKISNESYNAALSDNTVLNSMFDEAMSNDLIDTKALKHILGDNYGRFAEFLQDYLDEHGLASVSELGEKGLDELKYTLDKNGFNYEFSGNAFIAAREYNTLSDAINATNDAVKSGWATTFEYIFGNYEEAKSLWTYVGDTLWELFASTAGYRNEILKEWHDVGGRKYMMEGLQVFSDNFLTIVDSFRTGWREIFYPKDLVDDEGRITLTATQRIGRRLANISKSFRDFAEKFRLSEEGAENLKNTFKGLFAILNGGKAVLGIAGTAVGSFFSELVVPLVGKGGSKLLGALGTLGEKLTGIMESLREKETYQRATNGIKNFFANFAKGAKTAFGSFADLIKYIFTGKRLNIDGIEGTVNPLITLFDKFKKKAKDLFDELKAAFQNGGIVGVIKTLIAKIQELFAPIKDAFARNGVVGVIEQLGKSTKGIFGKIKEIVFGKENPDKSAKAAADGANAMTDAANATSDAADQISEATGGFMNKLREKFGPTFDLLSGFFQKIRDGVAKVITMLEGMGINFKTVIAFIGVISAFKMGKGIASAAQSIKTFGTNIETASKNIKEGVSSIGGGLSSAGKSIKEGFLGLKDVKQTVKTFNFKSIAMAILAFVAAIGIIIFAIVKLAQADKEYGTDAMFRVGLIVAAIAGLLTTMIVVFSSLQRKVTDFNKNSQAYERALPQFIGMAVLLLAVGSVIKKIAKAMIALAAVPVEGLVAAMAVVVSIFVMLNYMFKQLYPIIKDTTGAKSIGLGGAAALIGVGIIVISLAMKLLSTLVSTDSKGITNVGGTVARIIAAVGPIVAILLTFSAMIRILKPILTSNENGIGNRLMSFGGSILMMALAINMLVLPLEILSHIKISAGTVAGVVALIATMGAVIKLFTSDILISGKKDILIGSNSNSILKATTGMVLIASALLLLVPTLEILSHTNVTPVAMAQVITIIGTMSAAMFLVGQVKNSASLWKAGVGMIAMATALLLILAPLEIIAHTKDWDKMSFAIITMMGIVAGLGALFVLFAWVLKKADFGVKDAAGVLVLASTLLIITAAIGLLSFIDWKQALASATALGIVIAALGLAAHFIPKGAVETLDKLATVVLKFAVAAAAVGIIVLAISNLIKVMKDLDNAKEVIEKALEVGAQAIKNKAPVIAQSTATVVTQTLKTLGEMGAQIANNIMDFLIGLINGLADRVDELLPAIKHFADSFSTAFAENFGAIDPSKLKGLRDTLLTFTGVVILLGILKKQIKGAISSVLAIGLLIGFITAAFLVLSGMDTQKIEAISKSLSTMGAVFGGLGILIEFLFAPVGKMSAVPSMLSTIQATIGVVAAMGILIMGLFGIAELLGALGRIPGVMKNLELAQAVMTGIGAMIGGFVGGISLGLTSVLPEIGQNLSTFMDRAAAFIDGLKSLDPTALDNADDLLSIVGRILGGTIIYNSNSAKSLESIGTALASFGPSMCEFSDSIKGVDPERVGAAAALLTGVADIVTISKSFSSSANMSQESLMGQANFTAFVQGLGSLAPAMKNLADVGKDLSEDNIGIAVTVLRDLADAAKDIPNSGGLAGLILGNNDIDDFADMLVHLGEKMSGENGIIAALRGVTLDDLIMSNVQNAADMISIFATAAEAIPNGGASLASIIFGENDLDTFADMISHFVTLLTGDSGMISAIRKLDINSDDMLTINRIGTMIGSFASAAEKIPNFTNDFVSAASYGGKNTDLGEFGEQISSMITSITTVVKDISDKDFSTVKLSSVAKVVGDLADIQEQLVSANAPNAMHLSAFATDIGSFMTEMLDAFDLYDGAQDKDIEGFLSRVVDMYNQILEISTMKGGDAKAIAALLKEYVNAISLSADAATTDNQMSVGLAGATLGASYNLAVLNQVDKLATAFPEKLKEILQQIMVMPAFMEGWQAFGEACFKYLNEGLNTKDISENLPEFAESLVEFKTKLGDLNVAELTEIITNLKDLITSAGSLHTEMTKVAKDLVDTWGKALEGVVTQATTGDPFHLAASAAGTTFVTAFKETVGDIGAAMLEMLTGTLGLGAVVYTDMYDAGDELVDRIIDGMDTEVHRKDARDAINNVTINQFEARKAAMYNKAREVGQYAMQGLDFGLRSYTTVIKQTVAHIGEDIVIGGLKSATDERSPSHLAYAIGRFVDIGLVNGLVDYSGYVYDSATMAGDSAIAGISHSLSGLAEAIAMNEDSTPVIRPIVDMTEVDNAANQIDAIMANRRILTMGASIERNQNEASKAAAKQVGGISFTQINNSPKALSRIEIYRQTKSQISKVERMVRA